MEINKLISIVINKFEFISKYEFEIKKTEIYNKNNPNSIFIEFMAFNDKGDDITITLYPNKTYEVTVSFIIKETNVYLSIKNYLNHKLGNPPKYVPSEIIDKNNFEQDLERYAKEIEHLLDTDLNKVIKGAEWIEIPTYDPRDDY